MRAYFEYVNSQGGVYGRKIKLLVGDDHFNPADTVEVVRKLVEQDDILAIVGGLGDAPHARSGSTWRTTASLTCSCPAVSTSGRTRW